MITSPDNQLLKTIRKLHERKHRERTGLFIAEGEDLVAAADGAGWEPEAMLVAAAGGVTSLREHTPRSYVEPELLAAASTLGSGARAIGIYPQRWAEPSGDLSVYLHGVGDPGNVGAIIRSANALADGPVILGPACADPFSPKAVRASMGSVFARPPARAEFSALAGTTIALDPDGGAPLGAVVAESPVVLCLGAEREGLPPAVTNAATVTAHIPLRDEGPDSLGVAAAAAIALHETATRMP